MPNEGFIEIKGSNGIWGGICDDSWDQLDADVVCRMLGYPSSVKVYTQSSPFGHGTGSFVLADVGCVGTETSVFDCPHSGEGVHDCNSEEWAGVKCRNTGDSMIFVVFLVLQNQPQLSICYVTTLKMVSTFVHNEKSTGFLVL